MHSSEDLASSDFDISVAGNQAGIEEILPGFNEQTRIGILLRRGFGAVGASTLIMAAVTAFYDIQRHRCPTGFYRYADYFLFHTDHLHGNHAMLDIFPDHKEVVVGDDPESILRSVNDRAITHLLVPDGPAIEPSLARETQGSAIARLQGALVYAADGRVSDADVEIRGNPKVDYYVWATLHPREWMDKFEAEGGDPASIARERSRQNEVDETEAERLSAARPSLLIDGRTTETFRRASIDEALSLISSEPGAPAR
jgi:hypothetical protein